jgi:hypothetical protein
VKRDKEITLPNVELGLERRNLTYTTEETLLSKRYFAKCFQLLFHSKHDFFFLSAVHSVKVQVFFSDSLLFIMEEGISA